MGVWEGTTNLVANGGMETNDTGWTDVSATGSRVTSQAKFGSGSLEVVTGNAAANEGCYHTFAATAAAYTVSAWVRGTGGTVRMAVRDNAGGSAQTGSAVTLTSSWQRISLTTTALSAATWRCYVETDSQQALTFQVDGVQAEQQPLATPYVETNGGTASRSESSWQVPVAGILTSGSQLWMAGRMRFGWSNASEPYGGAGFISVWRCQSATYSSLVYYNEGANGFGSARQTPSGADAPNVALAVSVGDVATVIGRFTPTLIATSVNGGAFSAAANTNDIGTPVTISGSPVLIDSDIFWFAFGAGTLTDADAATIHAWGNSDPPPGLFPPAADLKMIWRAIDGTARAY